MTCRRHRFLRVASALLLLGLVSGCATGQRADTDYAARAPLRAETPGVLVALDAAHGNFRRPHACVSAGDTVRRVPPLDQRL